MSAPEAPKQRLFFALWPDDAVRNACANIIKQAKNNHNGKAVQLDNLHITLAFLGNVSTAQRECVEAVADSISMTPFKLEFDHVGWFKRPKVLWLGTQETPDALVQLVTGLGHGVRGCNIELDKRPFAAHLTLMRKVREFSELEIEPVEWCVDRFCLVQSFTYPEGVEYRVVRSWQ